MTTTPTYSGPKGVWVYSNYQGKFILVNDEQPFRSKSKVSQALGMKRDTINSYIDTGNEFRGYYLYSQKLEQGD